MLHDLKSIAQIGGSPGAVEAKPLSKLLESADDQYLTRILDSTDVLAVVHLTY